MNPGPSLTRQLQISILGPTSLALLLLTGIFVFTHWRAALTTNRDRLDSLARVISENGASALAFRDRLDAESTLAALQAEQSVREAALYDESGKLFALYRVPDAVLPTPVAPGEDGILSADGRLVLFRAVEVRGKRLGTLFIRWDLRPFKREVVVYTLAAVSVSLALLWVVWLLGRYLQRQVSQPILDLAETARAVGDQKNYAVRAVVPRVAELATLAKAFNHMLVETQASQRRLAHEAEATRRVQEALAAREEQLRLITDATPALISYIDPTFRYRFANKQYEIWFGRRQDEVVGRTMAEVLGERAAEILRPRVERSLQGEYLRFEVESPYRDGGSRWIDAHYIPHRASDGRILGICVLVVDITERKRFESALAKAHDALESQNQRLETLVTERTAKMREVIEELEAFSYSIAHDMRAPLRSMQGYSRVLLEEHGSALDADAQSYLQRITGSADRLDRLIQDVLNYSKVVRGELKLEIVNLHPLVESIIGSYPNLQSPAVQIELANRLPSVRGNEAALTQVISNLLGNAVKFVPRGVAPKVRVFSEVVENPGSASPMTVRWVRVWFEDNGIGIPKAAQSRLFGMFQRIHRAEHFDGTGIGLAIVRKAVERMGGSVGVESEEGRGSRFWVQLRAA